MYQVPFVRGRASPRSVERGVRCWRLDAWSRGLFCLTDGPHERRAQRWHASTTADTTASLSDEPWVTTESTQALNSPTFSPLPSRHLTSASTAWPSTPVEPWAAAAISETTSYTPAAKPRL